MNVELYETSRDITDLIRESRYNFESFSDRVVVEGALNKSKFEVVVPLYKEEDLLPLQIENLAKLSLMENEGPLSIVYVVNNSGSDILRRPDIIRENKRSIELIRYISGLDFDESEVTTLLNRDDVDWDVIREAVKKGRLSLSALDLTYGLNSHSKLKMSEIRRIGSEYAFQRLNRQQMELNDAVVVWADADTFHKKGFFSGLGEDYGKMPEINGVLSRFNFMPEGGQTPDYFSVAINEELTWRMSELYNLMFGASEESFGGGPSVSFRATAFSYIAARLTSDNRFTEDIVALRSIKSSKTRGLYLRPGKRQTIVSRVRAEGFNGHYMGLRKEEYKKLPISAYNPAATAYVNYLRKQKFYYESMFKWAEASDINLFAELSREELRTVYIQFFQSTEISREVDDAARLFGVTRERLYYGVGWFIISK